jgi:hypothetical protein
VTANAQTDSPLTNALRQFEATEANLTKAALRQGRVGGQKAELRWQRSKQY